MNYKLVAADLDDSLLGDDRRISKENKKAIEEVVKEGGVFTIATGRPLQGCVVFVEELGLDVPFITYNGALVIKGKSMEVLYHKAIEAQDGINIIKEGKKNNATILVFHDNKLYVNELNERTKNYHKTSTMLPHLEEDLESIAKMGATKILLYHEPEEIKKIQQDMKENFKGKVNFHISKPYFLEFVHQDVSKGDALAALAQSMGISSQGVIAIGDSYNDISMIEYAGLGVAVSNAHPEVKVHADYISKSNREHGVAQVLRKFVLGE